MSDRTPREAEAAIFDVVMRACVEQAQKPERFGGGIIGRAAAVIDALHLDGDLPMSSLSQGVRDV